MATERGALVAAILDAPDDDVPRLVFADWLEEQGGEANVARADFIRTQVERAKIPPEDERQSELQARELRLLKRFGPIWCGSHHVFKKVRFRRGFIESVHLHLQHYLHHRRQMLALEPVREIRLTGWHRAPIELIRRVANCEELAHLDSLTIHHQGPHKDSRGNMVSFLESPHLTRLRKLHCSGVQFDLDTTRWNNTIPGATQLQEWVIAMMQDWGTGLEIALYEDAITHFFGGRERVEADVAVMIDGRRAGTQRLRLIAPGIALKLTALCHRPDRFEHHARRLLAHLDLRAMAWINVTLGKLAFTTLKP